MPQLKKKKDKTICQILKLNRTDFSVNTGLMCLQKLTIVKFYMTDFKTDTTDTNACNTVQLQMPMHLFN